MGFFYFLFFIYPFVFFSFFSLLLCPYFSFAISTPSLPLKHYFSRFFFWILDVVMVMVMVWTWDMDFGSICLYHLTIPHYCTCKGQESMWFKYTPPLLPPDIVWHWYNRNAVFLGLCLWEEGVCTRTNDLIFLRCGGGTGIGELELASKWDFSFLGER